MKTIVGNTECKSIKVPQTVVLEDGIRFYRTNTDQEWIRNADTSKLTELPYIFAYSNNLEIIVPNWNVENFTSAIGTFRSCTLLTKLDISNWRLSKCNVFSDFIYACPFLHTLKWNHFGEFPNSVVSFNFYNSPLGTGGEESLKSLKDTFVYNSYDRKANGLSTLSITFVAETKALFTEEELEIMANKGYVIK